MMQSQLVAFFSISFVQQCIILLGSLNPFLTLYEFHVKQNANVLCTGYSI